MTVKVALSARNLQKEVNYINPYKVLNDEDSVVFTIKKLEKEVKQLNKKEKKKFKVICHQILATSTSFFTLVNPIMAATNSPQDLILPSDILEIGMWAIGIMAVASFILTIILLQSASVQKMIFRKKKKVANEWMIEILKGFTTIMLAPVIVLAISLVMYLLFGNLEFFVSPF